LGIYDSVNFFIVANSCLIPDSIRPFTSPPSIFANPGRTMSPSSVSCVPPFGVLAKVNAIFVPFPSPSMVSASILSIGCGVMRVTDLICRPSASATVEYVEEAPSLLSSFTDFQ